MSELTHEVADEGAVEVGDALHAPGHVGGALGLAARLLLVVIVAQHEAEQQSGHDDVADAQHGEVAPRGAREHQLARERETGHVSAHAGAQVQLTGDDVQRVISRLRGYLHHHVTVKDVCREEDLKGGEETENRTVTLARRAPKCRTRRIQKCQNTSFTQNTS